MFAQIQTGQSQKLCAFFMQSIIAKSFKDLCEYLINVQSTFKALLGQTKTGKAFKKRIIQMAITCGLNFNLKSFSSINNA